jgi:hypothetical protein
MAGPWRGGIAVRRMDRGQVAVADFLCAVCMHHRRVTGRAMVVDFLNSSPIEAHRTVCTSQKDTS